MNMGTILNGNTLLLIALIFSSVTMYFLARSASGEPHPMERSRQLYYLTSVMILLASILLFVALISHDFQNAYVYNNSSRDLPGLYLVAAFWAGNQGSFLLWLLILNILGIVVVRSQDEHENILMAIIIVTQIFFLIIILVDSPFRTIWEMYKDVQPGFVPKDGLGMNPVLIDPWMVSHPPILFLGYASSVIPFGYAIAALIKKDYTLLIKRAFPWVLFSMVSLGVGIFLGGYWAYKVLGWGGYWGWDPVENSSLIPWIVAVALVHGLLIQKRKGSLVKTNIVLSLIYFILVFYSTYLTRSGILADFSVHSFSDYGLTVYLVSFLLFYIAVSAALFIFRFKYITSAPVNSSLWSWDTLSIYGIIILISYSFIILIGTSMPIISGLFLARATAVTQNFYNNISVPFGIFILLLMVLSIVAITSQKVLRVSAIVIAISSVVLGVLLNIAFTKNPIAYAFSIAGLFVIFYFSYDLYTRRSRAVLASRVSHIGMGFLVIGIITSNFHSYSEQKTMYKGRPEEVASITLTFTGTVEKEKPALQFIMEKGGGNIHFETEYYYNSRSNSPYRSPYIYYGLIGDMYITPVSYSSGIEEATSIMVAKGEEATLGNIKILFNGFNTKNMTSGSPSIYADLVINGQKVSPGIKIVESSKINNDKKIPGTDRTVSISEMDVSNKRVLLYVSPGNNTVIPPDSVIVEVSHKRLIWLVWLGTVLITCGGLISLFQKRENQR